MHTSSRSWGSLYSVEKMEPEALVELITDVVLRETGASATTERSPSRIRGVAKVLDRFGLRHDFSWDVRRDTPVERTSVRFDMRYARPGRWMLFAVVVIAAVLFAYGVHGTLIRFAQSASISGDMLAVAVVGIALSLVSCELLILRGSRLATLLLDEIADRINEHDQLLAREPFGQRVRSTFAGVMLIGLYGALLIGGFVATASELDLAVTPARVFGAFVVLILLAVGASLCFLIALSFRRPGVVERLSPAASAITSVLGLLFMLTAFLPLYRLGTIPQFAWESLATPHGSNADEVAQIRVLVFVFMGGTVLSLVLGIAMLLLSLRQVDLFMRSCLRLQRDAAAVSTQRAVSGARFLRSLQAALTITWIGFGILVWIGIIGVLLIGLDAIVDGSLIALRDTSVAEGVGRAVAFLIGGHPIWWTVIARVALGSAGVLAIGLPICSISHYVLCRRRVARTIFKNVENDACRIVRSRLREATLHQLDAASVLLAVVPSNDCRAAAHVFGLGGSRRYIEISEGTLEVLHPDELDAVVSHELAHHVLRHCHRHNILHLLGRITLFGSGFAGTLENSFGYEMSADAFAISQLGIRPCALKSALLKIRAARVFELLMKASSSLPFEANSPLPSHPAEPTLAVRLRLWITLYTSDNHLAYWHPAPYARLADAS